MSSVFRAAGGRIATPPATDEYGLSAQTSVLHREAAERAKIAAKQEVARARIERFQDPRYLTIGLDVEALDKQRAEKEERRRAELEAERRFAEEQDRIRVAIAKYEEQKKADARAKQAATLANIQQQMALKAERESADLNDPLALRKSRPAREGDFDPRLGVSSAQVFDGEDLYAAERGRMQAEQMKAWCLEAQGARLAKAQEEKAAQREYAEYLERVGKMKDDYEAAARAEAARRLEEAKAYNLRMAAERREAALKERQFADKIATQEIEAVTSSGLLAERLDDATSTLGPHRVRPDHYRGMSPEAQALWLEEVARQKEEKRLRELQERLEDIELAESMAKTVSAARRIEVELEREKEAARQRMVAELERQKRAAEDRAKEELAHRKSAGIARGFYSAFGSSAR